MFMNTPFLYFMVHIQFSIDLRRVVRSSNLDASRNHLHHNIQGVCFVEDEYL